MEKTNDLYKQVEQVEKYLMSAGELLNEILHSLKQPINTPTETYAIAWTKTLGPNGEYERAEPQNNPDFTELQKKIDDRLGKLNENGFFYWRLQDGSIGKKPSKW